MHIAESGQQTSQDGPGGIGMQLLIQDGLQQRFKRRVCAFHPQPKVTHTFHQRAQLSVGDSQLFARKRSVVADRA